MELIGYMITIPRTVCQIKVPELALATKSTYINIKKLKMYLSNEQKRNSR